MGAMTQTIIEMEFGDAIGKRRNKRMIEKLKDHYIICGYGRVGRGAADELVVSADLPESNTRFTRSVRVEGSIAYFEESAENLKAVCPW